MLQSQKLGGPDPPTRAVAAPMLVRQRHMNLNITFLICGSSEFCFVWQVIWSKISNEQNTKKSL